MNKGASTCFPRNMGIAVTYDDVIPVIIIIKLFMITTITMMIKINAFIVTANKWLLQLGY